MSARTKRLLTFLLMALAAAGGFTAAKYGARFAANYVNAGTP